MKSVLELCHNRDVKVLDLDTGCVSTVTKTVLADMYASRELVNIGESEGVLKITDVYNCMRSGTVMQLSDVYSVEELSDANNALRITIGGKSYELSVGFCYEGGGALTEYIPQVSMYGGKSIYNDAAWVCLRADDIPLARVCMASRTRHRVERSLNDINQNRTRILKVTNVSVDSSLNLHLELGFSIRTALSAFMDIPIKLCFNTSGKLLYSAVDYTYYIDGLMHCRCTKSDIAKLRLLGCKTDIVSQ